MGGGAAGGSKGKGRELDVSESEEKPKKKRRTTVGVEVPVASGSKKKSGEEESALKVLARALERQADALTRMAAAMEVQAGATEELAIATRTAQLHAAGDSRWTALEDLLTVERSVPEMLRRLEQLREESKRKAWGYLTKPVLEEAAAKAAEVMEVGDDEVEGEGGEAPAEEKGEENAAGGEGVEGQEVAGPAAE
jgi:hypothetical protein